MTNQQMNTIPGAEVIGYGFNSLNTYEFAGNTTHQLFDLGVLTQTYTYPQTNITYLVPANVSASGTSSSQGSAYSFSSRTEFNEHFQANASVSGSYGFFSGQFSASYSTDESEEADYSYGLYQLWVTDWSLSIPDPRPEILHTDVHDDYNTLPTEYTSANRVFFFKFLEKYGTHYIKYVEVGGSLYYYVQVENTYSYSKKEIEASIKAEYKALTTSVEADANADWSETAKNWTEARSSHVSTVGAGTDILNWVSPSYGTYDSNNESSRWTQDVEKNPAPVSFQLEEIWKIFPDGDGRQSALKQAYSDMLSYSLYLRSGDIAIINLNNEPLSDVVEYTDEQISQTESESDTIYLVKVFDRSSLDVLLDKQYEFTRAPDNWQSEMNTLNADLSHYLGKTVPDRSRYMVTLVLQNGDQYFGPDHTLYENLVLCGAGEGLDILSDYVHCAPSGVSYCFAGVPEMKRGDAVELCKVYFGSNKGTIDTYAFLEASTLSADIRYTPRSG